jgi:hypothetical protein
MAWQSLIRVFDGDTKGALFGKTSEERLLRAGIIPKGFKKKKKKKERENRRNKINRQE